MYDSTMWSGLMDFKTYDEWKKVVFTWNPRNKASSCVLIWVVSKTD